MNIINIALLAVLIVSQNLPPQNTTIIEQNRPIIPYKKQIKKKKQPKPEIKTEACSINKCTVK